MKMRCSRYFWHCGYTKILLCTRKRVEMDSDPTAETRLPVDKNTACCLVQSGGEVRCIVTCQKSVLLFLNLLQTAVVGNWMDMHMNNLTLH